MIHKRTLGESCALVTAAQPRGSLKLEELLQEGNWALAKSVIEEANDSKTAKRLRSILALALTMEAPEEVIRTIIAVCPQSASEEDQHGRLPIHLSCLLGASTETVRRILETDPTSAMRRDNDGRVALHYAAQYCVLSKGETLETVESLCAFAPKAAYIQDFQGFSAATLVEDMASKALVDNDAETAFAASEVSWAIEESCASTW